jgi:hypothetical protein
MMAVRPSPSTKLRMVWMTSLTWPVPSTPCSRLVRWVVGWLVGWLECWLIGWSVGWLRFSCGRVTCPHKKASKGLWP